MVSTGSAEHGKHGAETIAASTITFIESVVGNMSIWEYLLPLSLSIYMYKYKYIDQYKCIYVYMYVYIYIYMYI